MLYQKLGQREGVLSLYDMPDIETLRQTTKYPIASRIPSSGTPLLVEGIGIVRGTRHAAAAKEFYEFVTTSEALKIAAEKFVRMPARPDVADDSLPQWIRDARADPADATRSADSRR
jgi:iron(III) transport system substrate-binding protein